MKILSLLLISILSVNAAGAVHGTAKCYYEIFTPDHFEKPIITETFELDLSQAKFFDIEHKALKRIIRAKYSPATLDTKTLTHLNFTMTYAGASSGAVVPATSGHHIVVVGNQEHSDLIGAFLRCDVKVKGPATLTGDPDYDKVVCNNLNDIQKYQSLIYTRIRAGKYKAELVELKDGKRTTKALKDAGLYVFRKKVVNMNNVKYVAEFNIPKSKGAEGARVTILDGGFYESYGWICKVY